MCSGLLRALESFSNQATWNNPDRYWISILTLVNWVGNVLLPLYGVLQVVLAVDALRRIARTHDGRRGLGTEPGRGHVLLRIVGACCAWESSGFNTARPACPRKEFKRCHCR